MKRVLLGVILVACGLQMTFASTGAAAEIPPTTECVGTFRALYKVNQQEIAKGVSDKEERQSGRRFLQSLADVGCLSDIGPLMKSEPAKPYSTECVAAASAAEEFWGVTGDRIIALDRRMRKIEKRYNRRLRSLRTNDSAGRKADRLERRRERVTKVYLRRADRAYRRADRIVAPKAAATNLIYYEFIALRCTGENGFDATPKPKGPVGRLVRKNVVLIWISLMHAWSVANDNDQNGSSGGDSYDSSSEGGSGSRSRISVLPGF